MLSPRADGIHEDSAEPATTRRQTPELAQVRVHPGIRVGQRLANCGLEAPCAAGHFPLHLHTGVGNRVYPKLCVDGN